MLINLGFLGLSLARIIPIGALKSRIDGSVLRSRENEQPLISRSF